MRTRTKAWLLYLAVSLLTLAVFGVLLVSGLYALAVIGLAVGVVVLSVIAPYTAGYYW